MECRLTFEASMLSPRGRRGTTSQYRHLARLRGLAGSSEQRLRQGLKVVAARAGARQVGYEYLPWRRVQLSGAGAGRLLPRGQHLPQGGNALMRRCQGHRSRGHCQRCAWQGCCIPQCHCVSDGAGQVRGCLCQHCTRRDAMHTPARCQLASH